MRRTLQVWVNDREHKSRLGSWEKLNFGILGYLMTHNILYNSIKRLLNYFVYNLLMNKSILLYLKVKRNLFHKFTLNANLP
jgi:hypothetical protein